ncbi:MAG TPA: hypothetical protein VJN18_13790 [Polyangiaceae bacterium]|nr:hypothetical protein [Polyangiaceae bacterium]
MPGCTLFTKLVPITSAGAPLLDGSSMMTNAAASSFSRRRLPAVWNDPNTPERERRRMLALVVEDVTVFTYALHSSSSASVI